MRIGIPCEKPDLGARVGTRLGTSPYFMVVDLETMAVEAVPHTDESGQSGSGMQVVVLAISKKVDAVLTGYCGPTAEKYLAAGGIEVLTGFNGTVAEALDQYRKRELQKSVPVSRKAGSGGAGISGATLFHALRESSNQFINLIPILVGVVLLIGLFHVFVSRKFISSLFSGNMMADTLWGACIGSIFAGNPINSYIIGGELLAHGVSLFAVTALIMSWVSVGLVQLPAEISALGGRFALARNALSFVLSIAVSFSTVIVLDWVKGLFL